MLSVESCMSGRLFWTGVRASSSPALALRLVQQLAQARQGTKESFHRTPSLPQFEAI